MNKRINKDCLVCIKKVNDFLKIEFLDFDINPLTTNQNFIRLTNLLQEEKSWEDTRDVGYDLVFKIKRELTNYFHQEKVLTSPDDAYATEHTIGQETLFEKIPEKIDDKEAKYFIYHVDDGHHYTLSDVIYKLKLTFNHYLYKQAILKAKNNGYLAYSHRKFGWNTERFNLDENFRINVYTNFGYGKSSYFTLTLYYNEIPIIPYTKVIYYPFVNASSVLDYTNDYDVNYESFMKCFSFVAEELKDFKQHGKDTFIYKHITQSLDELTFLIDKIMDRNVFYFVDTAKINSYLDLNDRKIIYDYEYLIDNVNPQAVNEKALRLFLEKYEELTFNSLSDEKELKMFEELAQLVLNKTIKEKLNENFNKESYAYAIAILISKYSDQNLHWNKLDDDAYNQNIQAIIKKILTIEENYNILIHRKSGINLMVFRNERIQLILDMVKNVNGLSKLIDSNQYISRFHEAALLMKKQNENYLLEIEPLFLKTHEIFLEDSTKLKLAKESFENNVLSKQVNYYHELIKLYENLIDSISLDFNKQTFTFGKNIESIFDKFLEHIRKYKTIESVNFNKTFLVRNFGHNSFGKWSIENLHKSYAKTKSEEAKQAYLLMKKTIMYWYGFLSHFDFNHTNVEHLITFNGFLHKITISLVELSKLLKDDIDFKKSFNEFISCFYENHQHYLSLKTPYKEGIETINTLDLIAKKSEEEFKKIESYKNTIVTFNKQITDKLASIQSN